MNIIFIETLDVLNDEIFRIFDSELTEIGVDLESNSLYRYRHDICLIQISAGNRILLIDSLKLKFPKSLRSLLESEHVTKVFQDMQYDLALVKFNHDCDIRNVFDVSLVDRLIRKENNNRKLDKIVADFLNIETSPPPKSQKSNWGLRPLSENQIEYAAYDVRFLPQVYRKMSKIMEGDFRRNCIQEYVKNYTPKDYRRKYNVNSMWKLKNIDSLNQIELYKLQKLLVLRDQLGKRLNRPLYWICKDQTLLKLAKSKITHHGEIKQFFKQHNELNRYVQQGIDDFLKIMMSSHEPKEKIEPPVYGVSLKTWIPLENSNRIDHYPDPDVVLRIKKWQNLIISELGLIPEFIREKGHTGFLASLFEDQWLENIKFPGIPSRFYGALVDDLKQFMSTEKSNIELKDFIKM